MPSTNIYIWAAIKIYIYISLCILYIHTYIKELKNPIKSSCSLWDLHKWSLPWFFGYHCCLKFNIRVHCYSRQFNSRWTNLSFWRTMADIVLGWICFNCGKRQDPWTSFSSPFSKWQVIELLDISSLGIIILSYYSTYFGKRNLNFSIQPLQHIPTQCPPKSPPRCTLYVLAQDIISSKMDSWKNKLRA